jgi:hypothetical protein
MRAIIRYVLTLTLRWDDSGLSLRERVRVRHRLQSRYPVNSFRRLDWGGINRVQNGRRPPSPREKSRVEPVINSSLRLCTRLVALSCSSLNRPPEASTFLLARSFSRCLLFAGF